MFSVTTFGPEGAIDTTDRFGRAASALREIFDFGDRGIITALEANIAIFSRTVRTDRQLRHISQENQDLRREVDEIKKRMGALEASCDTSDEGSKEEKAT